jgi:eukaryotic-like serine/threonine-protein kinase
MTNCPSDEILSRLLVDALDASEQDHLAHHIEGCTSCQGRLAHLTDLLDETWQSTERLPQSNEIEEEIVRRLKLARPGLVQRGQSDLSDTKTIAMEGSAAGATWDSSWPDVPGYQILGILGKGGMAVVFKARHLALQRIVALKMLQNWEGAGEKELARFRAEAEVIAKLQHPNIVQIYDVGDVAGRPYFALEYVAGGSLAHRLNGTPQPARQASQFVETLSRAVHAAHSNGIVHRDLKPANILLMLGPDPTKETLDASGGLQALAADGGLLSGVPKIADFGVAKRAVGDVESRRALTVTGDLLGTPSYMAPEQAETTGPAVGPAADIYALGAILYELLTGRPPFKGTTPLDTVLQVLHSEPVAVTHLQPNVPRDIETICLKCLRKEPQQRYQSANDLADDIQGFLRGGPIKARPRGAVEKAWRWIRNHPVPSGLIAAGVLTPILALAILSLLAARLVRSSALESAAQEAEMLERANNQYSLIVQRVEKANYPVNKMVPPTPDTVPLSIPATFLHDVGEDLHQKSETGIQVRQYSEYPFPWRKGGPRDDFERDALERLQQSRGQETVHAFTEMDGEPVVRYAQARLMRESCVKCHNEHPKSTRTDWKVGDVRGVLEIIRPLKNDEARITQAFRVTLLLTALGSTLLVLGSVLAIWTRRQRIDT